MNYLYNDHASSIIRIYNLSPKTGKEYGSRPCPNCGGEDRFWISEYNGELKHHCRQNCDLKERTEALIRDGALPKFSNCADVYLPYHKRKSIGLVFGSYTDGDNLVIPL